MYGEDRPVNLPVANRLGQPGGDGEVVNRCLKNTGQVVELSAGSAIDVYAGANDSTLTCKGQVVKMS